MGRPIIDRTGEIYLTVDKEEAEIIECFGDRNCTIRIKNEKQTILKNIRYSHLKEGKVRNPYYPSVFGIGYIGEGKYKSCGEEKITKIYRIWKSALGRSYSKKIKEKQPTYEESTFCKEWECLQNFGNWYDQNYKENFELDKDILFKGNKHYSPETCCFVPKEINILFTKNNSKRGDLPIGVSRYKNKFRAYVRGKSLGIFDTPEEAFQAYKTGKEDYIKSVAKKWKPFIELNVYNALYNYKVEITD